MERRRLGRTGHESSVVAFGGAALSEVSQQEADQAIDLALAQGVNHFDVAPSYGEAELRMAPWLRDRRDDVFLGCKTQERGREEAKAELHRSLERLGTDRFDLYQLHAVVDMENLDLALGKGGAIEAIVEAREEGLVRYLGITGHNMQVARVQAEALRRFPFDTVMFPLNFKLYADDDYRRDYESLMELAVSNDVGVQIIKAVAKAPWRDRPRTYATRYEPFDDPERVDVAVAIDLAQPVPPLCRVGDVRVLPVIVDAAVGYESVSESARRELLTAAGEYDSIFPAP
jgi:aryl-alcohol dehydrogenase-like predicted oxidoreductase